VEAGADGLEREYKQLDRSNSRLIPALHSLLDNPDNQKLRQELEAQIDATKAASKKLATDMQPNEEDVSLVC
jgi:hypothetical protein